LGNFYSLTKSFKSHHIDDHFPQSLPLFLVEVDEDVVVLVLQQFEGDGQVMILKHRLVIVHQGKLGT
jgi:hypothetical protein